jgi:hypothetical protein
MKSHMVSDSRVKSGPWYQVFRRGHSYVILLPSVCPGLSGPGGPFDHQMTESFLIPDLDALSAQLGPASLPTLPAEQARNRDLCGNYS